MSVEVRPVRGNRELSAFLRLPHTLDGHHPGFRRGLREDLIEALAEGNPLWRAGRGERELFLAWREGTPVGRVLAHAHLASNTLHGEPDVGYFGLLACPDDREVAHALLDATLAWHRARGRSRLRGPYELTITGCIGVVTSGFERPPSFSQSWNPPHIAPLLEGWGMQVAYTARTMRCDDLSVVDEDAMVGPKQRAWLADPAVRLRTFDMDRFEQDMFAATDLLNQSFRDNWGFVPLSPEEVRFIAAPMRRVVRPELTVFLEAHGRPVGVGLFLPDFNQVFEQMRGSLWPFGWATFLLRQRAIRGAVAQFIATDTSVQNKGVMRIVVAELVRNLKRAGFTSLDGTWIGDSNAKSIATAESVGMREKHRLAVYTR